MSLRILTDRHHADLLYAMQRLFEDRLDVKVYIPIGHEWWDEGYWQFGACFGDDRLAQQYLIAGSAFEPGYDEDSEFLATFDVTHPSRLIRAVTVEQFRALDGWAFVMPTVQENQAGYARLAREIGARYLYQVGNTGQQVDLSLHPTLINTSEYRVPDGQGVTIHQEMDTDPGGAYGFREPTERRTVRNFVNLFHRLPGYAAFEAVEQALADWTFTTHGHEGRNGFIVPSEAQGALMASAGFGWHDKPVGDGFGHVIHGWAAVGRPIIGRAAFYRGKMAEPLWTPETSIDTGGKSLGDVVREMQAIAGDADRHTAMCCAIRAKFDSLVNYEAEADAVRSLLGL